MSYEMFRNQIVTRLSLTDIPASVVNRVMQEIDIVSQDFSFERQCKDMITYQSGVQSIVKSYIAALSIRNCARTTLADYTRILSRMFDTIQKPYTLITANDIRLYLASRDQSGSWCPETKEHNRSVICSFFTWLVDNEYLIRNPAKNIPITKTPKKKQKPLKQIELEIFRDACQTPREKALVDMLFASGMRVSEACNVKLENICWEDRTIVIEHGKGDKERFVCFNPKAEVTLRKYLETRKGNSEYLFCKLRAPYTRLRREAIEVEIRKVRDRVADKIGVKAVPHTFRRTMATQASERGMSVEEIQMLLGHATIDTTMRYITMSENRVKNNYSRCMAG